MDGSFGREIEKSTTAGLIVLIITAVCFGGCCGCFGMSVLTTYQVSVDIKERKDER